MVVASNDDFNVDPEPSKELENSWLLADEQVALDPVCVGSALPNEVAGQTRRVTIVLPHELQAYGRLLSFTDVCQG